MADMFWFEPGLLYCAPLMCYFIKERISVEYRTSLYYFLESPVRIQFTFIVKEITKQDYSLCKLRVLTVQ